MPGLFRQLHAILPPRQRWQAVFMFGALVVRAAVELVGVASVVPFMSVVADPASVQRHAALRWLYERGGFGETTEFLVALGVGVIVVMALSNAFSAFTTWAMLRFVWNANHQISNRLLQGYLAQPYGFFVQRNSSHLHKTLLSEVGLAISGVLMPVLNVMAQGLVVVALAGMLLLLDPVLAVTVILVLGGAYGGIYLMVRRRQAEYGHERLRANQLRFKVTSEAFGGIKDVKILQREHAFLAQFDPASKRYSHVMASSGAIAALPKYLLETLAFGGILLIVIYYLKAGQGVVQILPTISLYAFAGYRMMPALQTLFSGFAAVRFNRAALEDLGEDLAKCGGNVRRPEMVSPMPFRESIRIENVSLRYPAARKPALDGISMTITRDKSIGLVGASGSGKTTLVDLLLGLYTPDSGCLMVDDTPLTDEVIASWRRQVGYVPQHIFLTDDTVTNNIAFGVPPNEVDAKRVEEAARIAHLHDFILTLSEGYETMVGERGVRLSGGQRQRIGIARALYHDPAVLVMDEATSALDGATEDAVMEAIRALAGQKTIVLIAHRLTTVEACDRIYLLEDGRVTAQGTFEELAARSTIFRMMAKLEPIGEGPPP